MSQQLEFKMVFPTTIERLYEAWLDSDIHSAMSGAPATASPDLGAEFTAWEDYIWGTNLQLLKPHRIVQSWRTSDFLEEDEDSIVTIHLKAVENGTELHMLHTNLPEGSQDRYRQGWQDFYFKPMQEYFEVQNQ